MLGVGVFADGGDLAVADSEDADVAVVVGGTAPGGGTRGPLGDDLVAGAEDVGDFQRHPGAGLQRRWLEYDAARDWLPAQDQLNFSDLST